MPTAARAARLRDRLKSHGKPHGKPPRKLPAEPLTGPQESRENEVERLQNALADSEAKAHDEHNRAEMLKKSADQYAAAKNQAHADLCRAENIINNLRSDAEKGAAALRGDIKQARAETERLKIVADQLGLERDAIHAAHQEAKAGLEANAKTITGLRATVETLHHAQATDRKHTSEWMSRTNKRFEELDAKADTLGSTLAPYPGFLARKFEKMGPKLLELAKAVECDRLERLPVQRNDPHASGTRASHDGAWRVTVAHHIQLALQNFATARDLAKREGMFESSDR